MAVYTVRINGVDKALSNVLLENFSIREVTNGINTLVCDVESSDASYRPVKRQTIEVEEDDGTSPVRLIFGGLIKMVRERGFGQPADGIDDILMTVTADSYRQLAERRFVTESIPAGTLKQALQAIEPYLNIAPHFVTLDPGQANGPTLDAIEFDTVRVDECLNFLAGLTAKYGAPFTWTISYDKILGMYQTGTIAGPWNLIEGDGTEAGDVEVEPTDDEYANKIIVIWGSGKVVNLGFDGLNTPEVFTGDGVTNSFPLKYQLVGPIPPPPLTSPPTASAIGYAFVNVPGGLIEFLGNTGTFGAEWEYDQVTNSVSRVASPPPLGYVFSVPYRGLFQGEVTAEDAGEIAAVGLWEDKILAPEIEDPVLAQSVANAELARRIATGRIVRFRTRRIPCVVPGETITITVPKRNISGTFEVTDVATDNEPGGALDDLSPSTENNLIRTVTCNLSIKEQEHQTLTRWWSEKDTTGISQAAGASAVPDWPLNSVQFNDEWRFGGAAHVLYGDLFYSNPDLFLSPPEVQSKGLVFVQNQDIGDAGHIGLTDPQRVEMGMIGEGDFSIDMFSIVASPDSVQGSILLNATGDIFLTASTGVGTTSHQPGEVGISGYGRNGTPGYSGPLPQVLFDINYSPEGVSLIPGAVGESFTRLNGLNILDGLCGFYLTVSSLPFTVHTTAVSDQFEFLTFFVTAGTGTINLPDTTNTGGTGATNLRVFPETNVGRMFFFKNLHASGTVTLDPFGAELIDGAASLALPPGAGVLIHRYDTSGWKVLLTTGGVTLGGGGGGSAATPGGANLDVQFNDSSTFGGENAFTYDKTKDQLTLTRTATDSQLRIKTSGSDTGIVSFYAQDNYADIRFGWEEVSGVSTSRRTGNAGYFWWQDTNTSPNFDGIGAELSIGETAGSPMAFAQGRGFAMRDNGRFDVYQYGGLGTGSVSGPGVYVQHNDSGSGNAAYLALEDLNGVARYIWFDATGAPRTSTDPPQEDGTPSDTSGTLLTASGVTVITALAADPGSPSNGDVWVRAAGTTPTRNLELRIRDGGVSYTIASITV